MDTPRLGGVVAVVDEAVRWTVHAGLERWLREFVDAGGWAVVIEKRSDAVDDGYW